MKKKGATKQKKHLRLRKKVVLNILVFLLLALTTFLYIKNAKVTNIYVYGNHEIKDATIIENASLKNYPHLKDINKKHMEEEINKIPLINSSKIKISPLGKVTINVEEENILFLYNFNNKYITSKNNQINNLNNYYGYPILINFTPDTVMQKLVKGLKDIDQDIIKMINEIEYTPYKKEDGTIIDENRFTLKMNDQNTVLIDIPNIKNLNKYKTIYASLGMDKVKGVVYLDTIIDERLLFKSYDSIIKDQEIKKANEEKEEKK